MPRDAEELPSAVPPSRSHDGSGQADWIIDPVSGALCPASPRGAELLARQLDDKPEQVILDGATPALALLRRLIASGELSESRPRDLDLLIWTARRPASWRCHCSMFAGDGAHRVAARLLTAGEPAALRDTEQATTATLQRIADRIRADLALRAARQQPAPPASAPRPDEALPRMTRHLGKLAHEMRTPLAAIAVMSEIMRDERFGPHASPKYADYARSIHDSARHLLAVVECMLEQNALTTGRTPVTFVEIDVASLVTSTVEPLLPLAAASRVELLWSLPKDLPRLIADERTVRQILLNLLTNALKFTPPTGTIEVAAAPRCGDLMIIVADTGPGFGAVVQASEEAEHVKGSGLGLPLCRALAARNGASLELESEPGRGTRARLVFPASRLVPV